MISDIAQQSDGAWTESTDPDAAYREQFLKLLDRLELKPAEAIALAEASTGCPFEKCSPLQLVPLLQELLELLRLQRTPVDARQLEP